MKARRLAALWALLPVAASAGLQAQAVPSLVLRVENPLALTREVETVAVPWQDLAPLPGLAPGHVRVLEATSRRELVAQALDGDADGRPDSLLFQSGFAPREVKLFLVEAAVPADSAVSRAHVKFVPEREDVAWESDRIAFRIYGRKLWELENLHTNGIDVWLKRVRKLVLDDWYGAGHDSYHVDRGEGADFFEVGATLGAGGTGIWHGGRLLRGDNFLRHRLIADGPVRALFEVEYGPIDVAGRAVSECKRVSIDGGQQLFRQESTFRSADPTPLEVAVGLARRPGLVGATSRTGNWPWLAGWGPVARRTGGHGDLGTAVLAAEADLVETRELADHYVTISRTIPGRPLTTWVGAGWTAAGDFRQAEDWWRHLDNFAERLARPLQVSVLSAATGPGPVAAGHNRLEEVWQRTIDAIAERYLRTAATRDPAVGIPRSTDAAGAWRVTRVNDWTSGFFAGTLWQLFSATGRPELQAQAERWTRPLAAITDGPYDHDLGFQFLGSFGQALRSTGDERWRGPLLTAARLLAGRFNPAVDAIKSWDWMPAERPFPVIVDNMMNLELLFRGASLPGGDPRWRDLAMRHARTTSARHVRPDGGSFHVVVFDPASGAVLERITNQGLADSSTWARGQAWLTYGFTMAFRESGEPEFLEVAKRGADYTLARLPADGVPCWDYQAPGCPDDAQRDASAAAINASALLELASFVGETDARRYRDAATRILTTLASPAYFADAPAEAALAHSVGSLPGRSEVDVGLVYADYYFVEALMRWREGRTAHGAHGTGHRAQRGG